MYHLKLLYYKQFHQESEKRTYELLENIYKTCVLEENYVQKRENFPNFVISNKSAI